MGGVQQVIYKIIKLKNPAEQVNQPEAEPYPRWNIQMVPGYDTHY